MSFRCTKCQVPQPTGTRPHRVVTKGRPGRYGGWSITAEASLCSACLQTHVPPTIELPPPAVYYEDNHPENRSH